MKTREPLCGPVLHGTLVAPCADTVAAAYAGCFGFRTIADARIGAAQAAAWGLPDVAGLRMLCMSTASGAAAWLRVIELPDCLPPAPLKRHGWIALEVNVRDVDRLAMRLELPGSPFRIIGKPAFLEFSDQIRAMQVIGPAGEVLYLTEVRAPVPPFALPLDPVDPVDRLFIPVLSVPRLGEAAAAYEALAGGAALRVETRITVLNAAFGRPADSRYPIGVLQLAGQTLIEIDEVAQAEAAPLNPCGLPSGIAMVGLAVSDGQAPRMLRGTAGEWTELLPGPGR
ncbi:hypothetical protein LE190_15775 [Massilia oculi]|uniref:VOC family protein n=1 Tax=Massilia hydrophila TaxID=3044279 RepID=A0ABS7YCF4_9BURK|nr:hypothetical protein [Massilia oculi]MCA1857373.1 hypothetical protein [Massilia oculi]